MDKQKFCHKAYRTRFAVNHLQLHSFDYYDKRYKTLKTVTKLTVVTGRIEMMNARTLAV